MNGHHQSPFWNQDAILAFGLAFAGLAVLQSKLLPDFSGTYVLHLATLPFINRTLNQRVIEWWPVLLIVSGIVVWISAARSRRNVQRQGVRAAVQGGGAQ